MSKAKDLRFVLFQNVQSLGIFIPGNHEDEEQTAGGVVPRPERRQACEQDPRHAAEEEHVAKEGMPPALRAFGTVGAVVGGRDAQARRNK